MLHNQALKQKTRIVPGKKNYTRFQRLLSSRGADSECCLYTDLHRQWTHIDATAHQQQVLVVEYWDQRNRRSTRRRSPQVQTEQTSCASFLYLTCGIHHTTCQLRHLKQLPQKPWQKIQGYQSQSQLWRQLRHDDWYHCKPPGLSKVRALLM